ncbi:uncharacterized protein LOC127792664 [Diospyros lotus]|uniref:uncharacterized protein LOC127792664 n=1 Tax=Diospyros lotus TaxID=55363 RepID=UPI00224D9F04|nr:uncharacterized protein LOC127792664 [Diospyros lotus]
MWMCIFHGTSHSPSLQLADSMETRRVKTSSGDNFTFPSTPTQNPDDDPEFEFGSVTPTSPNSPADHLFFNGRLLPHAFPLQPTNGAGAFYSRSTSRTSSVGSKDSLMSSRSNSTNSRSSSCSASARTSTSTDASERRSPLSQAKLASKTQKHQAAVLVQQYYGYSQRWQFIAPAPGLCRQASRRKKAEVSVKEGKDQLAGGESGGFCWRFFRSLVSACKECHAIEPSNMELQ